MAISYTTVWWSKVLKPIKDIIASEFRPMQVYISDIYEPKGNIAFRLFGENSALLSRGESSEVREYEIELAYYLKDAGNRERAYEKIYRDMDRLNQLIFNYRTNTDSGAVFFDAMFSDIRINDKNEDEELIDDLFVAKSDLSCKFSLGL